MTPTWESSVSRFWLERCLPNPPSTFPRTPLQKFKKKPTQFLESTHLYLGYIWEARFALPKRVCVSVFVFFFFSRKVWLFNQFSATCGSRALFTNPQISLFSNFLIKNGSHGTIYTFKNYFAIVFFNFQFSTVSKRTLDISTFSFSYQFPLFLFSFTPQKQFCYRHINYKFFFLPLHQL